jgi:hypothetical protein
VERASDGDWKRFPHGVESNWSTHSSGPIRAPYLITRIEDTALRSRYAYTWRGLRRERDRELGIAGGEFFIVDRESGEVLGMKRNFNSTYVPKRPEFTNWFAARECGQTTPRVPPPMPYFTIKVLRPDLHVNDAFVPEGEVRNYHKHMLKKMERTNAE